MSKMTVSDALKYLTFTVAGEKYAVPLMKVKEVLALGDVTPVPFTPPHFKGIMNLRGQVISVIDLRIKLQMPTQEPTAETAVLILDLAPLSLGTIVDSVDSVMAFKSEDIQATPHLESTLGSDFISGVARQNDQLILILNIEKTLSTEDLNAIKKAAA